MRPYRLFLATVVLATASTAAPAQESYKIEVLKEAPPTSLAKPVRESLNEQGYRVVDGQGKPFADLWLRKEIPASGKPAGAKGAVQFPVLTEGELLGAIRYSAEGHDYRDQSIAPGVYTLRYLLQPVNGDHLGVSPYRDYALLAPASKDAAASPTARPKLESQSAEAAGSNHPAVLLLLSAKAASAGSPTMAHDEAKNLWMATLPLSLLVKGESAPTPLPVQLVIVGAAMT